MIKAGSERGDLTHLHNVLELEEGKATKNPASQVEYPEVREEKETT